MVPAVKEKADCVFWGMRISQEKVWFGGRKMEAGLLQWLKRERGLVLQYIRAAWWKESSHPPAVWMLEDYKLIWTWVLQLTLLLNGLRLSLRQHVSARFTLCCNAVDTEPRASRGKFRSLGKKCFLCWGGTLSWRNFYHLEKQLTMNSNT